jgi:hypothetical protein
LSATCCLRVGSWTLEGENREATYALLLLSAVVAGDKGEDTASLLILIGVGVSVCDPP